MFLEILEFLKKNDVEFYEHADTSDSSYIKCGGSARLLVLPASCSELVSILRLLCDCGVAYRVLGNMSNTMLRDGEYNGVIVKTTKLSGYTLNGSIANIEAGCSFKRLLAELLRFSVGGAEELFMIPGTVGAMVSMNAGAYGKDMSKIFIDGDFYDPKEKKVIHIGKEQMRFSYRTSYAKSEGLICLSARLSFSFMDFEEIRERIAAFARMRRAAQPTGMPSLGSVFKRRLDVGMGYYIDKAGLKGFTVGGAEVSRKHAGFIINTGNATASDVITLTDYIKTVIYDKFGLVPDMEIEII